MLIRRTKAQPNIASDAARVARSFNSPNVRIATLADDESYRPRSFSHKYHEVYCPTCFELGFDGAGTDAPKAAAILRGVTIPCCNCADDNGNGNAESRPAPRPYQTAFQMLDSKAGHAYDVTAGFMWGTEHVRKICIRVHAVNRTSAASRVYKLGFDVCDVNMIG